MKLLFLLFVFLIITVTAKAEILRGEVRLFSGSFTGSPLMYSYYALETENKERLLLPILIDSPKLANIEGHELILEGSIEYIRCSEEEEPCPTGEVKEIQSLQFLKNDSDSKEEIFTGKIERIFSTTEEIQCDYIAIVAGKKLIEIPKFLNSKKLLELNPQVTIVGEILENGYCPLKLKSLRMLKLQF